MKGKIRTKWGNSAEMMEAKNYKIGWFELPVTWVLYFFH